jgi:uncharacterized protein YjbI with pentapeptide repeats
VENKPEAKRMAGLGHSKILEQGVEKWNQWRKDNPCLQPYLNGANLNGANLSGANLNGVNLGGADLNKADLSWADLAEADLSLAKLNGAKLNGAKLSGADLAEADLAEADLSLAKLNGANLNGANLSGADLSLIDLSGANLNGANLSGAKLSGADLSRADLAEADLAEADLNGAKLNGANLYKADLSAARLINAILDNANLEESCLWETQRAGWSIKAVICESIYWDKETAVVTSYGNGDFERLHSEKTKVLICYPGGINSLEIASLPALIQHLGTIHQGYKLYLESIQESSGGAIVTLVIDADAKDTHPEQIEQLRAVIQLEVEQKAQYLRRAFEEENLLLKSEMRALERQVAIFLSRPTYYLEKGSLNMGDTYNIDGQAGAVGPNAHAHDMTFNQIASRLEKSVDFVELAKQLAELRQAILPQQSVSPQAAIALGKVAEAELGAIEKNASKVVESLKAAGQWTLDFARDIGKEVVVEAIKQSMGLQ